MREALDDLALDAIEARAIASAPPPWHARGTFLWLGSANGRAFLPVAATADAADAEFIAHAREDVPRLVREVRLLRTAVANYQEYSRSADEMTLAAARELAKEISAHRRVGYLEAVHLSGELITSNLLRHRGRDGLR